MPSEQSEDGDEWVWEIDDGKLVIHGQPVRVYLYEDGMDEEAVELEIPDAAAGAIEGDPAALYTPEEDDHPIVSIQWGV